MSELVELEHLTMPGRTISVPEAGVWHRERAGWRRTEQAEQEIHLGDGEPLVGVEHPADGTWSPAITNEPSPASDEAAGSRSTDVPSDDTTETEH